MERLKLFNAVKATLTWGEILERGETPKDAADMGKGPAWEDSFKNTGHDWRVRNLTLRLDIRAKGLYYLVHVARGHG